jgi:uncharacterized protein
MNEDQSEAIAFLRTPSSYGAGVERVDLVETHISIVFLAGEYAYKLKRAVRFPYLDFSTRERRREACEAELALNRRTAPGLYLEVRALSRNAEGRIGFAAGGEAVDWVVVMRRFEEDLLFDRLASEGRLSAPLMESLADEIARFHEAAERRPQFGGAAPLLATVEENDRCLGAAAAGLFNEAAIAAIGREAKARIAALAPLIEARRREGKVRRCHGDLHLRNICLVDGKPTLFDCLEFSEALAAIDTLYDLAFLLMDLEHRGETAFANRVLNRYLDWTDEEAGLALLPLFLSLRAAIRAHVTAATIAGLEKPATRPELKIEAQAYLALARRVLAPRSPRLVAIGGLSGTGKTTLAQSLAPELGARPGARVLRSDVVRKRLMGVAPETSLPPSAYRSAISRRVYEALRERAAAALAAGSSAIVDAVFLSPEDRRAFAAAAEKAGVPFTGLWLGAPPALLERRIAARRGDASDATAAVLHQQLRSDPGRIDWLAIDAAGTTEECLAAARAALREP